MLRLRSHAGHAPTVATNAGHFEILGSVDAGTACIKASEDARHIRRPLSPQINQKRDMVLAGDCLLMIVHIEQLAALETGIETLRISSPRYE